MEAEVAQILNMLDAELDKLELVLKRYPEEHLGISPAPGKWSAKQLLEHLRKSESLSLQACMSYYRKGRGAPKGGLPAYWRSLILRFSLNSPIRFKSPEIVRADEEKINEVALKDILADLKLGRRKLREAMEEIPKDALHRLFYKHPVVGRLTIWQMLRFFQWHFRRHAKQALRAANKQNVQKHVK